MKRRSKYFTLIEMLIALSLVALIAMVSSFSLWSHLKKREFKNTARICHEVLQSAYDRVLFQDCDINIQVSKKGKDYWLLITSDATLKGLKTKIKLSGVDRFLVNGEQKNDYSINISYFGTQDEPKTLSLVAKSKKINKASFNITSYSSYLRSNGIENEKREHEIPKIFKEKIEQLHIT